jgi:PKD repeat protein
MPRHLLGCPDANKEGLVKDRSPQAVLTLTRLGSDGDEINIDGSASFARQGTLRKWRVDLGDGSAPIEGTGFPPASLPYTYATAGGTVIVTLYVEDNKGRMSTVAQAIEISVPSAPPPMPPSLMVTLIEGVYLSEAFVFDIEVVGQIASYHIDYGDGTVIDENGAVPTPVSHTYGAAIAYVVTVRVTASNGLTTEVVTDVVVAADPIPPPPDPDPDPPPVQDPPIVALEYVSGQFVGETITWSTEGTHAGYWSLASWSIDYGDGTVVSAAGVPPLSLNHVYATSGAFQVALTCTDTSGQVTTVTLTTTISALPAPNQPPQVTFSRVSGIHVTDDFVVAMSALDPDGDTIASSRLNWGDGSGDIVYTGAPPATASKRYGQSGIYTAQLVVTDQHGLGTIKTLDLTVFAVPPTPPSGTRFATLSALSTALISRSLRNQVELNDLTKDGLSMRYTYDFASDPYPAKQDAAKLIFPTDQANIGGGQKLVFPVHQIAGTILVTWDYWFGPEWQSVENGGNLTNAAYQHKEFHCAFDEDGADFQGSIFFETQTRYQFSTAGNVGVVRHRIYPAFVAGATDNNGAPGGPGIEPPNTVFLPHSTWMRYVQEIRLNQDASQFPEWEAQTGVPLDPGLYHMCSSWILTPTSGPLRILYKIPINRYKSGNPAKIYNGISAFWFQHNTSSPVGLLSAPAISYGRDVVVLKNYVLPAVPEDDTLIFERPA